MANIAKRADGRWRAGYRDARGNEHARHFARKIDAQHWIDSVTTAVNTGTYVDPAKGKIVVSEWADRWLSGQGHLKPSTYSRYAGIVRAHVLPQWRDVPLLDISHAEVQSWVSTLSTKRSPSTARKAHRVLSLMLSLAVRDGRLVRNPADGVGLPRETQRDRRYLTHQQVRELATVCGRPLDSVSKRRVGRGDTAANYELVVLFLAYTGVRFGEMAALRVRRIDPLRRRVEIAEAVTSVDGALVWGTPKGHSRRWVSVPRFVAEQLGAHVQGLAPDDLVFTSPQGEPLRAGNFRRDVFTPASLRVGLEGLVPHGLRHTAASLAIAAGADVKVVQQMLGHKSATMTLDLYGHLFDDRLDDVAEALDEAARRSGDKASTSVTRLDDALSRRQAALRPRTAR